MSHHHHGGGGGGGGGSSSSTGVGSFQATNEKLARGFWYVAAGVVGIAAIARAVNYSQVVSRRRKCQGETCSCPSRPAGLFSIWATATAICREMSYPQFHVPIRHLSWASPPPLGRIVLLLVYWAIIIYMMADKSVIKDVYFWERIGYRNAWVTATQVPLAYMLAMKINPIGLITGISHERLNWLHRWVARTMFVTATVHGFHFWTEWVLADFVEKQLENVSMIKYGLGAWGVLLWNVVTGFYPLRSLAYEVFVIQHIVSALVFIWLIYEHVPEEARYNVWFSIALIVFDRVGRWALLGFRNLKVKAGKTKCEGTRRIGHDALVLPVGKSTSIITIKDVHFPWRAGQHLYLWMPAIGPVEAHPYTIACAHRIPDECICNSIELVVRKHKGFSQRLHAAGQKELDSGRQLRLTAFVSGPYGNPPRWDVYDTLVLISASTGASFTLPILESLVRSRTRTCVRRIDFILTSRKAEETEFYIQRLREAMIRGRERGLELHAHIAVTGPGEGTKVEPSTDSDGNGSSSSLSFARKRTVTSQDDGKDPEKGLFSDAFPTASRTSSSSIDIIREYTCRLDIASHIRDPVEVAHGETSVVVCGGRPLVAEVRNSVARLSDERAVHKGTGAQGIHLHVEEYSF